MPESVGVIYVATRLPRYVSMAFLSALSLRAYSPGLSITLFTDIEGHPLASQDVFDDVIRIESDNRFKSGWGNGLFDKVSCLQKSPYSRTLFLDADTRIKSVGVESLFDVLDEADLAMAEALPSTSKCRQIMARPIYNTSTILYRDSVGVQKFLRDFEDETRRLFDRATIGDVSLVEDLSESVPRDDRLWLLQTDQYSLAQIASPDIKPKGVHIVDLG